MIISMSAPHLSGTIRSTRNFTSRSSILRVVARQSDVSYWRNFAWARADTAESGRHRPLRWSDDVRTLLNGNGYSRHVDKIGHRFFSSTVHCDTMNKFAQAKRLNRLRTNVWEVFAQLARDNQPVVHLGSGFPDMPPAEFTSAILRESLTDPSVHQETDSQGHPRLVQALVKLYSTLLNRVLSSDEVLVTIGAYEALYSVFTGFLNPGDEVILIEPYFDCYEAMITMAEADPVFVTMRPDLNGKWTLDIAKLRSAFTSRTKMIVINTPQNPTGKVFSRDELSEIAAVCREKDIIVVMDEVYEWTVFDGEHVRMATLPGMWDRTITVGSSGKSFGVTGWHIGWAYGPSHLLEALRRVHQLSTNSAPTPMQEAVARTIEKEFSLQGHPDSYWHQLPQILREKSQRLCSILESAGFRVIPPQAGYFVVVDYSNYPEKSTALEGPHSPEEPEDIRFARWLCVHKKILAIPPSVFYSARNANEAKHLLRFCFFKASTTLDQLEHNLKSQPPPSS